MSAHEEHAEIKNVNVIHKAKIRPMEQIALVITEKVGSFGFFLIILAWTILWLLWNFLAPAKLKFDPPMGFVFWLFISNMLQILLMPLIMVGQNLQGAHAELRSEHDYQVDIRAERRVRDIQQRLTVIEQKLDQLLKHLPDQS